VSRDSAIADLDVLPLMASPRSALSVRRSPMLYLAIGGYVFFLPVQIQGKIMNIAPSDLFLIIAILSGLGSLRFVSGAWSPWHAGLIFSFLTGVFITFSGIGQLTPYIFIKIVGLLFLFASYMLITSVATTWSDVWSILRTFVIAVTLNCAVALVSYLAPLTIPGVNYGTDRVSGMLIDPNAFGGLVMMALVIQGVTYRSGKPLVAGTAGLFCGCILVVALFLTFSRSAWMGLGMAMGVVAYLRPKVLISYVPLACLAAICALVLASSRDSSKALSLAERKNTAEQRLDQIKEAIPLIRENPILGVGIGGFVYAQRTKQPTRPYIHNTTVWMLTDFGLVGLTVFLGLISWMFVRGVRVFRRVAFAERPVVLGLLAAHAGMFGVSAGIEALYQRHWWLFMALLGASFSIYSKTKAHAQYPAFR
jgi:putative inorganic carbon (hco3(-)) transporter